MSVSNEQNSFVHLHTHSEYSLTDGAIRISDLVQRAKSMGHTAIALTDHSHLFGAVEFYNEAKKNNIKPIIGCEILHSSVSGVASDEGFHLVLLATSNVGYKNLIKIVSLAHLQNKPLSLPIVSPDTIQKYSEDIIALSSCLMGEFATLVKNNLDESNGNNPLETYVQWVQKTFAPNCFYVELIDNNLEEQKFLLPHIARIAKQYDLPLVATADSHYLDRADSQAHTILVSIRNELKLSHLGYRNLNAEFHLFTAEDMQQKYSQWPEAIANTVAIAERCQVQIEFGKYVLPSFSEAGYSGSTDDLLRDLSIKGLEERFVMLDRVYGPKFDQTQKQKYFERLHYECDVICRMGFPGYFLIVQDFINWAKKNAIPVGPGRGSGVGSLVAYALKITDLDPIPYNLLFERFLNPERVSMPDFDVDFCQDRREEVIAYVTEKYGSENVAQITTFGKMNAKAVIRDVGRALDVAYPKVDRVAKLIPNDLGVTLEDAYAKEPRIKEEAAKDPRIREMLEYAEKLEGLSRHTSVHAAGIVISDGPMIQYAPVYLAENGSQITQFEKDDVEKVGLIKFDFLGLKTLTVIDHAVRRIRKQTKPDFMIDLIPLEEPEVYKLISSGNTVGMFQLESRGMQQLIVKLKPSKFEDVIAVVALFRPGPLGSGMVDDFIERKHGRQKIFYSVPTLEPILKDTYGVILYQEQVQRIASDLAGYTLGEADLLRRAMGKKKPEEMAKQKDRFAQGCKEKGIPEVVATDLFELTAKFAEYGFNKSHSAAYGLVSYQTAYLKTFYPEHYMAAIMSCDSDDADKIIRYAQDLRRMGFELIPLNINTSTEQFEVRGPKKIEFSLGAIKGVGLASIAPIIDERNKNGIFKSLDDLAHRVDLKLVGKKSLELLTFVGAIDVFGYSREILFANIAELVKVSEVFFAAQYSGQRSLFGELHRQADAEAQVWVPNTNIPKKIDKSADSVANYWLEKERSLIGIYLSAHPLDAFTRDLAHQKCRIKDLENRAGEAATGVIGVVRSVTERMTKTGKKLTLILIEDQHDQLELVFFAKDPNQGDAQLLPAVGQVVIATIKVDKSFDGQSLRYRCEGWIDLESERMKKNKSLVIRFKNPATDIATDLAKLQNLFQKNPGPVPVTFEIEHQHAAVLISGVNVRTNLSNQLLQNISELKIPFSDFRY